MKKFEKRARPDESASSRTGPRARAAQERKFNDPYAKADRPPRAGGFARAEGEADRRPAARPSVITLDPDVARVFRDSESVNEVLRLVMRLSRFAGSRPAFNRDRPAPSFGAARGVPRGDRPQERRAPPRGDRAQERRAPPRPRTPRFKEE
jgi:hypothetical protein